MLLVFPVELERRNSDFGEFCGDPTPVVEVGEVGDAPKVAGRTSRLEVGPGSPIVTSICGFRPWTISSW